MKRIASTILVGCLLLTLVGCGKEPAAEDTTNGIDVIVMDNRETATADTTEAQTTTESQKVEDVYRNPLNGQLLDAPIQTRFLRLPLIMSVPQFRTRVFHRRIFSLKCW